MQLTIIISDERFKSVMRYNRTIGLYSEVLIFDNSTQIVFRERTTAWSNDNTLMQWLSGRNVRHSKPTLLVWLHPID